MDRQPYPNQQCKPAQDRSFRARRRSEAGCRPPTDGSEARGGLGKRDCADDSRTVPVVLSLLGLAKKAGRLEAGEEPVGAAARARDARLILLASDAAENSARRARRFAAAGACPCVVLDAPKDELGRAVGRSSCAMLAITDIGFAEAVAKRLAALDQERYGDVAETLSVKAARAAERKASKRRRGREKRGSFRGNGRSAAGDGKSKGVSGTRPVRRGQRERGAAGTTASRSGAIGASEGRGNRNAAAAKEQTRQKKNTRAGKAPRGDLRHASQMNRIGFCPPAKRPRAEGAWKAK